MDSAVIYAIVDENGLIVNRVVAGNEWVNDTPNSTAISETDVEYLIGGSYINGVYIPPEEPVVEPTPITTVTPRQARLALLGAGLLDEVEAAVEQAGGSTKITWEYATQIDRNDPLVETIGQSLNLTEQQIDDLFVTASTL